MAVCSMGWEQATHHLQLPALFQTPPQLLGVHLGGNDLVRHLTRLIFKLINNTFDYVRAASPDAILVWVDILPRFIWRAPKPKNGSIEKHRQVYLFGLSQGHFLIKIFFIDHMMFNYFIILLFNLNCVCECMILSYYLITLNSFYLQMHVLVKAHSDIRKQTFVIIILLRQLHI